MSTKLRRGRPRVAQPKEYAGRILIGAPVEPAVRDRLYALIDRYPKLALSEVVRIGVVRMLRDLETIDAAIRAEHETDASTTPPSVNPNDDNEGEGDDP